MNLNETLEVNNNFKEMLAIMVLEKAYKRI